MKMPRLEKKFPVLMGESLHLILTSHANLPNFLETMSSKREKIGLSLELILGIIIVSQAEAM